MGLTHWRAHIPGSLDGFLGRLSTKHRANCRRPQRKLEAAYPGQIRFRMFTRPEEVEELDAAASEVARQTYQYRRGGSYRSSQEGKRFLELAARNGWLRGSVLYVGARPVAFSMDVRYGDCCRMDTAGYLQDYKDFEPGIVLFLYTVDELAKEGVKELDFGTGDSVFKSRFGDEKNEITSACIFAPDVKGVSLMALKCLRYSAEHIGRWMAWQTGLEPALRKLWRSLPSALVVKQTLIIVAVSLLIILLGIWEGWLKGPEGALLTAALSALTALKIVRQTATRPLPPDPHPVERE
jgi:CelD/BcsL family acetyltransferase involved in cellulose biosynthesis